MVQTQCEPCQSGSQWKGVPGKGGPAIRAGSLRNEGAPRAAPEARALLHLPALYNRPACWNLARRNCFTHSYPSGT